MMYREKHRVVIYEAFRLDVAQGHMKGPPNKTRTHSCRLASRACLPLHHQRPLRNTVRYMKNCTIYIYMCVCVCVYGERDRDRETEREIDRLSDRKQRKIWKIPHLMSPSSVNFRLVCCQILLINTDNLKLSSLSLKLFHSQRMFFSQRKICSVFLFPVHLL